MTQRITRPRPVRRRRRRRLRQRPARPAGVAGRAVSVLAGAAVGYGVAGSWPPARRRSRSRRRPGRWPRPAAWPATAWRPGPAWPRAAPRQRPACGCGVGAAGVGTGAAGFGAAAGAGVVRLLRRRGLLRGPAALATGVAAAAAAAGGLLRLSSPARPAPAWSAGAASARPGRAAAPAAGRPALLRLGRRRPAVGCATAAAPRRHRLACCWATVARLRARRGRPASLLRRPAVCVGLLLACACVGGVAGVHRPAPPRPSARPARSATPEAWACCVEPADERRRRRSRAAGTTPEDVEVDDDCAVRACVRPPAGVRFEPASHGFGSYGGAVPAHLEVQVRAGAVARAPDVADDLARRGRTRRRVVPKRDMWA